MESMSAPSGHWSRMYQSWLQLGSPLRPNAEDVTLFTRNLEEWQAQNPGRNPRGLILGVTPELYALPWPDRKLLMAVDRTPEMIASVWPGKRSQIVEADWGDLPLPLGSVDMVFCDGGFHLLTYPQGQQQLIARLADVAAPGCMVVFRLFLPARQQETEAEVLAALLAGQIRDLNCLKLRLGSALMMEPELGVAVRSVWESLRRLAPDGWAALAKRLDWAEEHLEAIDAYENSEAVYHFAGIDRVIEMFISTRASAFELCSIRYPEYEMGDRCPVLALRRL